MAYIGVSPSNGVRRKHTYTATASQTSFSGAGAEGATLSYSDSNFVDVYQNGVKLADEDYTATSGTAIVLAQGASADDIVEIIAFDVFSVADTVSKADGGTFDGNVTMAGTLGVTGVLTGTSLDISGDIDVDGTTNLDVVDIDGTLNVAGETTLQTHLNMGDGDIIKLGASADLTIQHDGSHSYVKDAGTGNLFLDSVAGSAIIRVNDGYNAVEAIGGGAVNISHNGATKIATTSSGVAITGGATLTNNLIMAANTQMQISGDGGSSGLQLLGQASDVSLVGTLGAHDLVLRTGSAERGRLTSGGHLLVGGLTSSNSSSESIQAYKNGNPALSVARQQDGTLVHLRVGSVNGAAHGSISISGTTCSYNAFSGSHWSRLTDNSKPTILKGTVIETIDEMCDWYQAQFTVEATTKEDTDSESETFGQQIEDVAEHIASKPIELPSGGAVGDTISVTSNGITYDNAVIAKEGDEKHVKCKISDTADSKKVYGVHAAWDNDDDTVNDMYVTAVGTHVVRINGSVTVSAGDLLASNGDGTAKVQDDDIIRSKTIGKVLTNIKQETYDDDSYTVPCALYCG